MTSRSTALLVVAALAFGAPSRGAADPATACHCFRDRAYDPARPAAADGYILATTRSSTLAAVFGAEKASLVRVVMTGTAADDLWIAHWAGARIRKEPMQLLGAKSAAGSWKKAFAPADRDALGRAFTELLGRNGTDADLASVAVDDVVVSHLRAAPDVVHVTRAAGAGSPELILTLLLAPRLGLGPPEILAAVRSGKSWGALLTEAGIVPGDLDEVVKKAVKPPSTQDWLLK